ncbi:hypothetical protein CC80DRAFT_369139, partial [Byssothecium circinans]
ELARTVSPCIIEHCTMDDMVKTSKVQASLCNRPNESKSREVFVYCIICLPIGIVFVGLRLWGKLVSKRLAIDNWVCVGAQVLVIFPFGCLLKLQSMGFGEHFWNLESGGQLRDILHLFWICATTYILILGAIKVSLVLLYVEIFPHRRTRTVAYIILAFIVANTLVIYLSSIFLCVPVQGNWDRDINAKCMNMNAVGYAVSASSIARDLILLIFPLVCIRKLNMKRKRKIIVDFMFAIGTFGCLTTFLRRHTLLEFKITVDPTWDYVPVMNWTALELPSGFVCVSLPAVRILFVHYIPR